MRKDQTDELILLELYGVRKLRLIPEPSHVELGDEPAAHAIPMPENRSKQTLLAYRMQQTKLIHHFERWRMQCCCALIFDDIRFRIEQNKWNLAAMQGQRHNSSNGTAADNNDGCLFHMHLT